MLQSKQRVLFHRLQPIIRMETTADRNRPEETQDLSSVRSPGCFHPGRTSHLHGVQIFLQNYRESFNPLNTLMTWSCDLDSHRTCPIAFSSRTTTVLWCTAARWIIPFWSVSLPSLTAFLSGSRSWFSVSLQLSREPQSSVNSSKWPRLIWLSCIQIYAVH